MIKDLGTGYSDFSGSATMSMNCYGGLRPVVTLNSDVEISSDGKIIQDVPYKIEHYGQDINLSTYSLIETEEGIGPANSQVNAEAKTYTGFTLTQTENTVASGTVVDDGSLTLKLYYNRNTYKLPLNVDGKTEEIEYVYGEEVVLPTDKEKEGYTFEGWYDNEDLTGDPIEKVDTNEIDPENPPTYYIKWTANEGTAYTVKHYKQEGNTTTYTLADTENLTATTGETVTARPKTYEGYVENTTANERIPSGIVKGDGSLELILIYDTIKLTVTFKDGETVVDTQNIVYGENATAPVLTKSGYVLRWDKEFSNITSDTTVNAVWLKDTDGDGIPDIEDDETLVNYTIEHYKQNINKNGYEEPERETKQGNLGTTVTAEAKTYTGFSVVETDKTVASGIVVDDGSLVLKLYYDRQNYEITYETNGGTIQDENYATSYTYGIVVNLPTNVTKEGYTFGGWYENAECTGNAISQITENQTGAKTYYASWNTNGNTPYKVEHYKQTETGYTLTDTDNLTAETGANVTAIPKTYEGYIENLNHEERIASGTVEENGSLVLKLYYDMLTYEVTFKDGENVLDTQTINYGEGATAPNLTKQGYVLRWDKDFNNVRSNLTINAIWLRDTDGDGIPDIEDDETLVEYIVRHYKQQGNTNTYELADTETLQGQLGSTVTAVAKTYEGYIENEKVIERIASGEITGEDTLELRLFYDTIKYEITFKDGDEIVSIVEVPHGGTAEPPELTKPGYILSWDKNINNITGEQTITAVWTVDPNYKDPNEEPEDNNTNNKPEDNNTPVEKIPDDGKEEQRPSILPQTGETVAVLIVAVIGLLGVAVIYFVKYKAK